MAKLSVVINTLNEEKNIPSAISSVKGIADEVIVVDMHSDDRTKEVAEKLGAKVYEHERVGYVEPARNFAISKTEGDWILVLDADEEVPGTLASKIRKLINAGKGDYFRIPRKNIIFGKWIKHSRWWPDYNIRLFKKGKVSWNEVIHSVPMTVGVGADLLPREEFAMVHKNYEGIEQYLERMNKYTTYHSLLNIKEGYKFSWKDLVTKPGQEFLSRYFFGEGYKDGIHGLALALLQAFSELVMYLKIWQKEGFNEVNPDVSEVISLMKKEEGENHYWWADTLLKQKGGITQRIKRKFKLA